MVNIQDFIVKSPFTRKIEVDDLLFAEFECPLDDKRSNIWWQNNFFAHILTGETVMKTPVKEYTLKPGDSIFAKKGSIVSYNHDHEEFCELLIFVPDDFIRTVAKKYNVNFTLTGKGHSDDALIRLNTDNVLITYFQSLLTHFLQSRPPAGTLMKLKFEELLLNILSGAKHEPLKCYLSDICRSSKPSIREIMEANFFSNLSLEEFAILCARSLSAFKKEFHTIFNTTPGKWLQQKRLVYARYLLETTDLTIEEICMESGFESSSHFNRVFKNMYGISPGKFKLQNTFLVK